MASCGSTPWSHGGSRSLIHSEDARLQKVLSPHPRAGWLYGHQGRPVLSGLRGQAWTPLQGSSEDHWRRGVSPGGFASTSPLCRDVDSSAEGPGGTDCRMPGPQEDEGLVLPGAQPVTGSPSLCANTLETWLLQRQMLAQQWPGATSDRLCLRGCSLVSVTETGSKATRPSPASRYTGEQAASRRASSAPP